MEMVFELRSLPRRPALIDEPTADTVHAVLGGFVGQHISAGDGFDHRIWKLVSVSGESLVEIVPAAGTADTRC